MSSSDTVTETLDEGGNGIAGRVTSLSESVAPALARQAKSGNLAAASGVVSLVRAGRTFLKGNRKKGALQALTGLFWVAVALAQRRSGSTEESSAGSDSTEREADFGDVVDSSPDIGEVETSDTGTDHATGEAVVDTTDADIEESDTAPEVESDAEGDVDQRDVVDSDNLDDVETDDAEDSDDSESLSGDAAEADADETTQAEPDGGTETDGEDDE